MQQQTGDQYLQTLPCFRQHSRWNEQTVLTAKVMSSPHTVLHTHTDKSIHSFSYLVFPPPSPLHAETLGPETKAQVKVDKRCLWIFWVTHGNRCLHSPYNYLLTDLIQAVKWLAKSMCTQTGPERRWCMPFICWLHHTPDIRPSPSLTGSASAWPYRSWTTQTYHMLPYTHTHTYKNKINTHWTGKYG